MPPPSPPRCLPILKGYARALGVSWIRVFAAIVRPGSVNAAAMPKLRLGYAWWRGAPSGVWERRGTRGNLVPAMARYITENTSATAKPPNARLAH